MKNCVFCKIVKGEVESAVIWEDREFLAILDNQPFVFGMTVVLPKKHYNSKVFEMPQKVYQKFLLAVWEIADLLKKKLDVKRVLMVMEGFDVDHAHIKLYPIKKEKSLGRILSENYPAPVKEIQELKRLAQSIGN